MRTILALLPLVIGARCALAAEKTVAYAPRVEYLGGMTVCAIDPKALAAWYGDTLGIELSPAGGGIYWRSIDKLQFGIHPAKNDASGECGPDAAKGFVLTFHVDDYGRFLAKLKAKHVVVERTLSAGEYGTFAYFRDPENNLVAIWGK